jgi:hypothetical protein
MSIDEEEITSHSHRCENFETKDIVLPFRYVFYALGGLQRQEPDQSFCCVFNFSTSCLLPILSLLILTRNEGRSLDFSAPLTRLFPPAFIIESIQGVLCAAKIAMESNFKVWKLHCHLFPTSKTI